MAQMTAAAVAPTKSTFRVVHHKDGASIVYPIRTSILFPHRRQLITIEPQAAAAVALVAAAAAATTTCTNLIIKLIGVLHSDGGEKASRHLYQNCHQHHGERRRRRRG